MVIFRSVVSSFKHMYTKLLIKELESRYYILETGSWVVKPGEHEEFFKIVYKLINHVHNRKSVRWYHVRDSMTGRVFTTPTCEGFLEALEAYVKSIVNNTPVFEKNGVMGLYRPATYFGGEAGWRDTKHAMIDNLPIISQYLQSVRESNDSRAFDKIADRHLRDLVVNSVGIIRIIREVVYDPGK